MNENLDVVNIFIKIKPFLEKENKKLIQFDIINEKIINISSSTNRIRQFQYDKIFAEESSENYIFEYTCKPLINNCINGQNGAFFLYGQTGTGFY